MTVTPYAAMIKCNNVSLYQDSFRHARSISYEVPAADAQHPLVGSYHQCRGSLLQKTGLSTISEILRNRRLSLFGHVARLDPEVPANKALLLMVNSHEGRKPSSSWTRPPVLLAAPGSTLSRRMLMLSHFHLYGEQRSSGVMGRRNGPSGLRDDDDDYGVKATCG